MTLFFAFAAGASAACNAITGQHDRFLDTADDDSGTIGRDSGGDESEPPIDATVDKGPIDSGNDTGPLVIEVDVGGAWRSPNGATAATVDGGKRIDAFDAGANHPVIIPVTQPSIPSDDYTVLATVRAANSGSPGPAFEWGILTRVQSDGAGVVFSSSYGTAAKPFVGTMPSSDWNPSVGSNGTDYTYAGGQEYLLEISVMGTDVRAKFWRASDPKPTTAILWGQPPFATGRGVGFYTYGINDAVLEKMTITVP